MPRRFRAVIVENPDAKKPDGAIRLVCMSDTHGKHDCIKPESIPNCDLFLFAGDFSLADPDHVLSFKKWLTQLPFPKIVIAGNLDVTFDTEHLDHFYSRIDPRFAKSDIDAVKPSFLSDLGNATYLQHECLTINGLKLFGSPYTPVFCDFAFQIRPGEGVERWKDIPDDVDILLCHGPPYGTCDKTVSGQHVGSAELADAVKRIQPSLCVCGHIHEAHGSDYIGETLCCNVAVVDLHYCVVNKPTVIDLLPIPK